MYFFKIDTLTVNTTKILNIFQLGIMILYQKGYYILSFRNSCIKFIMEIVSFFCLQVVFPLFKTEISLKFSKWKFARRFHCFNLNPTVGCTKG